jgi:hypothetical protein
VCAHPWCEPLKQSDEAQRTRSGMKLIRDVQRQLQIRIVPHAGFFNARPQISGIIAFNQRIPGTTVRRRALRGSGAIRRSRLPPPSQIGGLQ